MGPALLSNQSKTTIFTERNLTTNALPSAERIQKNDGPKLYRSEILGLEVIPSYQSRYLFVRKRFLDSFPTQYSNISALEANKSHLSVKHVLTYRPAFHSYLRTLYRCLVAKTNVDGTAQPLRDCHDGSWYRHLLPLALELTGYYSSNHEILGFVSEVCEQAKENGRNTQRKSMDSKLKGVYSQFVKEAVSVEYLIAHAKDWTFAKLKARAEKYGHTKDGKPLHHWFQTIRYAYKNETGRWDRYMGEDGILAMLVNNSDLLKERANPLADLADILQAVQTASSTEAALSIQNASRDNRKYANDALLKRFPLKAVQTDPSLLNEESISTFQLGCVSLIHFVRKAYGLKRWGILRAALLREVYGFSKDEAKALTRRRTSKKARKSSITEIEHAPKVMEPLKRTKKPALSESEKELNKSAKQQERADKKSQKDADALAEKEKKQLAKQKEKDEKKSQKDADAKVEKEKRQLEKQKEKDDKKAKKDADAISKQEAKEQTRVKTHLSHRTKTRSSSNPVDPSVKLVHYSYHKKKPGRNSPSRPSLQADLDLALSKELKEHPPPLRTLTDVKNLMKHLADRYACKMTLIEFQDKLDQIAPPLGKKFFRLRLTHPDLSNQLKDVQQPAVVNLISTIREWNENHRREIEFELETSDA